MKIRTRLFIAFLILVGLGFYELVDWMIDELRPRYLETMEESMNDTATILSALLEQQVREGAIAVDDLRQAFDVARRKKFSAKIYQVTKTQLNLRVYVTDRQGMVVFDSDNGKDEGQNYARWNDVARTLRGTYGARTTHTDPADPRTAVLYVAAPISANGELAGVVTVCKPAASMTHFWRSARNKIIMAGIVAALAVVLLGMVISSWITWPIRKLTNYAHAVRDGQRVAVPRLGRSEMGELGSAFEQMRDALEGKQYVENYVQTLTHEMKSPLSAIRGAAELLEEDMAPARSKQFLDNIRAESNRIQDLVDRLLQLSALEKRKGLHDIEDINVIDLLDEVVQSLQPVLTAKEIAVAVGETEPLAIKGERFLIRQSLSNLLQNAVDFSPKRGEIEVALEKGANDIRITILDRGPGIPDYALSKVFDRFYSLIRPDTGKKSSGLGLSFVREAAILHGGKIELDNRPGGGVRATLTLLVNPPEFLS